jgi:putative CocE/NonD family hydrolase
VYGVGETANVPVTMADGTVLRADVYFPTDRATSAPAPGPFPVLLVQTPYGKSLSGGRQAAERTGGLSTGFSSYLVPRGYIDVVADVRGTGASGGSWGLFDPVQQQDGATLVRWAAGLPQSNGKVGTYGPSYLGIDQLLTANALGPGSPLKAMFPIVAGDDLYRDTAFMGGIPAIEFNLPYLLLTGGLHSVDAPLENPQDLAGSLRSVAEHEQGLLSLQARLILGTLSGDDVAYDEAYWRTRRPQDWLAHIAALGIPTYLVGGWFDLFQRGEPLNYSGLQNAAAGRPVGAPMLAGQPVSGRYQLLMGPWYHLDAGSGVDVQRLELQWFDRWLKGIDTGIDATTTPLHLYQLGSRRWVDTARYPLDGLAPTTLYLGPGPGGGAPSANDGSLGATAPAGPGGADTAIWTGLSNPCGRQTDQWAAGGPTAALGSLHLPPDPCAADDRAIQSGPGSLTYTTAPLAEDTVIGGPADVTVYATSTRPEVELEATLEDVAPSGVSTPLTSGALLGSFRALDTSRSWFAPDGRPLLPYHPYTRASARPVPSGAVTRFDIEVFPTFARLGAGHRLRLTLTTSDTPHLGPTPAQLAALAGGVYAVQRTAMFASFLEVPMAPASRFGG